MISGKLPNDTVWWLSTDGKKIWIENENLEQEKFKEKSYNIVHGRLFRGRKEVGELATSRLDSRRRKESWIIKLEAMIDVYPELLEEINRKEIEEKKKKKIRPASNGRKEIKKNGKVENVKRDIITEGIKKNIIDPDIDKDLIITVSIEDIKKDSIEDIKKDSIEDIKKDSIEDIKKDSTEDIKKDSTEDIKKDSTEDIKKDSTEEKNTTDSDNKETVKRKVPVREYFSNDTPYLSWINDQLSKSVDGRMVILLKDLKEKMGTDFVVMQDMRIYFGLKKVLVNIGATIDIKSSKGNSVAIIKKIQT